VFFEPTNAPAALPAVRLWQGRGGDSCRAAICG